MYNIAIISGDGIGREVMGACEYLLDKLDLDFSFKYGEAGFDCFNNNGTTLPDETVKIAKNSDAVLFGASTSTPGQPSPIINLRKELNVYANIRPIKSYKGVNCIRDDIDFVIVRENTEGLYSQVEYGIVGRQDPGGHQRFNPLPQFRKSFYKIAKNYPQIQTEDYYVDAMAMYLVTQPQNFDVIVSSNLFGDILSDESAGLVGGLGLAPSGNIGDYNGLFEPVHGSAPDIAGKNIANPCSMILSASMMLDYLGEWEISNSIKNAVEKVIAECKIRTPDLGGDSSTMDVTKAIVRELI